MSVRKWIGHTLGDYRQTGQARLYPGGYQIRRIQSDDDKTGTLLVTAPTVEECCRRVPTITDARILDARDDYGLAVIRIRSVRGGERHV